MPSTNGHGPKRAILYARVSTDEQARSGYSLAQQLEALRDYATREGLQVLEELLEQERAALRGDPEREAKAWLEKLSEVDQERRGFLRLAAKGHITDEELAEELAALDETRATAERELGALQGRRKVVEELERDRDALLEYYAGMVPEALEKLTGEERRQVYGMLRLRVKVSADGSIEASGILRDNLHILYEDHPAVEGNNICETDTTSRSTICSRRTA